MNLLLWNCKGRFRHKILNIEAFHPDIAIIPESERLDYQPATSELKCSSSVWVGRNKNKGLGIYAFGDYKVALAENIYDPTIEWNAPVSVTGPENFHLLAIWAMNHRGSYLRTLVDCFRQYKDFLGCENIFVAGDFNNNVIWDRNDKPHSFSNQMKILDGHGLRSLYHLQTQEGFGCETKPTLYFRHGRTMTYHIDYIFASNAWCQKCKDLYVGEYDDWTGKKLSDHVPLVYTSI